MMQNVSNETEMQDIMQSISFLQEQVPLFRSVSEETVKLLLAAEGSRKIRYEKGEYLCRSGQPLDGLLVVLSGRAEVRKGNLLLRELAAGDMTGVSALFSGDTRMETDILARTRTAVLFFPRAAVRTALRSDPQFADNYVFFLSGRIRFLNGIISRFSGPDATGRLARYLLEKSRKNGGSFAFRAVRAADELGMSRASLYRALDVLLKNGCIEKTDRQILIRDTALLEAMIDM